MNHESSKSEEMFRTVFDTMREGFAVHEVVYDDGGIPIDYRFLEINPAFERLTGLKRNKVVGKRVREVLPQIEEQWIEIYCRVATTGEPAELESYEQELDRYYRAKAYSPERGKFVVVFEDVTEEKKALRELTRREEQLRVIFDVSQAGIIMVDLSGVITLANNCMAKMLGYTMAELNGSRYPDHIHPEQRNSGDDRMRKLISGEIDHVSNERRYIRKDGSDFWGYLTGQRHEDSEGNFISLIGHITDISELKSAEEDRRHLEQQLLHAQKLESLGVLAGGIAHDFNNILMAIIGNADLALMKISKESPIVENLHGIEQAAARAADLAKQMLAYSGKGRFIVENLNLNMLLNEMQNMLQVSISKKAVLRFNLNQPLPLVEADATQMRQIVMNLVINASEAIGDRSGFITITTGSMDCDRSYLKDVWLDENLNDGLYTYLEVADSGCGMDRDTMVKLFDPFFTTKFTGRGLGMAAVLGIVRSHKGAIKVYSEQNKGTTFKILLPANNRPVDLLNDDKPADDWRGSGTVLLVDDEETVRIIGTEMLRELGFTTIAASDGREAVEIFKSRTDISFVLLDLTMPHMDGEQCFRELRRIKPDIRVIMSSGYNEQEVTQKFAGKGLAGFVQKPYKLSALRETIRNNKGS